MFQERGYGQLCQILLCQEQRPTIVLNNKDVSNNLDRRSFSRIVGLRLEWSGLKRMRGKKQKSVGKGNFQRVLLSKKEMEQSLMWKLGSREGFVSLHANQYNPVKSKTKMIIWIRRKRIVQCYQVGRRKKKQPVELEST